MRTKGRKLFRVSGNQRNSGGERGVAGRAEFELILLGGIQNFEAHGKRKLWACRERGAWSG